VGGAVIVPFAPGHAAGVVDVISAVFQEYKATFELSGFDADLTDVPRHYRAPTGCFVVLEDAGRVVGTAAVMTGADATCEVKRVYLLPAYRGRGHGRALIEHVLAWAQQGGARVARAWSDARFVTAHAVYERLGFVRCGERMLDDLDGSREYGFERRLPVRPAAPGAPRSGASP
jgi:putative acetyltransferase